MGLDTVEESDLPAETNKESSANPEETPSPSISQQSSVNPDVTGNHALLASLYPQHSADTPAPSDPVNPANEEVSPVNQEIENRCDEINTAIANATSGIDECDDDQDVEAMLGLPPPPPSQENPAPRQENENDVDSLDFSAMTKEKKGYWLNVLLMKAAEVIDGVPVGVRGECDG